jgi:hypothetical protein
MIIGLNESIDGKLGIGRTFLRSSTSSAVMISKSRLSMTASLAMRLMRSSSRVLRLPLMRFQSGSVMPDFRVEFRTEEDDGGVLRPENDDEGPEGGELGMVCDRVGDGIGLLCEVGVVPMDCRPAIGYVRLASSSLVAGGFGLSFLRNRAEVVLGLAEGLL